MTRRITQLGIVLLAASAMIVVAPTARGAAPEQHAKLRPAGPWYTPHELKALNAYSHASFAQKRVLLAAGDETTFFGGSRSIPPARALGYTPQELKALIAYSNASFAQKKIILAGGTLTSASASGGFNWGDAGIGAGVAVGSLLLAGSLTGLIARSRSQRRRLRHT